MPFIISIPQATGKLYAVSDIDGDIQFQPSRDKATRYPETEADIIAFEFNRYSQTEALVEGAKEQP